MFNKLVSFGKKLALGAAAALGFVSAARATDPTDVAGVVTQVQGISATASTAYISAAVIGVGALIVATVIYMSRKGWKLR